MIDELNQCDSEAFTNASATFNSSDFAISAPSLVNRLYQKIWRRSRLARPPPINYFAFVTGVGSVKVMPFARASAITVFAAPEKRPRTPTVMPCDFRYSRFVAICYPLSRDVYIYYINYLQFCK
jgi:hypothetical protein